MSRNRGVVGDVIVTSRVLGPVTASSPSIGVKVSPPSSPISSPSIVVVSAWSRTRSRTRSGARCRSRERTARDISRWVLRRIIGWIRVLRGVPDRVDDGFEGFGRHRDTG